MNSVNPEMLILARESRGLTQKMLAKKTGIGQSALSKYENGMLEISDEHVSLISETLDYPPTLFSRSDAILGFGSTCMYHRKRQSLGMNDLRRIQATINLMRMNIGRLLRSVEIEGTIEFPRMDIGEYENPESIAELARRVWQLPIGPIKNLVATIEKAGGIVIPFYFGNKKLDAVSQWPHGMPPLFFINADMPWDRIRFSLAHEVGHLIMHRIPTQDQEKEADSFASAFLMPKQDIASDLKDINLIRAAQLKPFWKVSMQALIYRAHTLKRISDSQYKRLFTELSRQGFRTNEPVSIAPEESSIVHDLISVHLQEHQYSRSQLYALLDLHQHEFESLYEPQHKIRMLRNFASE